MSDERIEINQPFRLIIPCKLDGIILDLSSGVTSTSIEYRSPNNVESKLPATILNPPGTDGKIYIDVAKDTFNDPRIWNAKPWILFTSGDELPGDPIDVDVYEKWEKTK